MHSGIEPQPLENFKVTLQISVPLIGNYPTFVVPIPRRERCRFLYLLFRRITMVCVLRSQTDDDPVGRNKRQGCIYAKVVNGIPVFGSRPVIFIAVLTFPTRYRFYCLPEIRLIACIRSLHVICEESIDREVPPQ